MAELSALIGPSNTTIGVGTLLGVQELDHVGSVERVTAADAVDHDNLGVHLLRELCDLEQAERRYKARLALVRSISLVMGSRSPMDSVHT